MTKVETLGIVKMTSGATAHGPLCYVAPVRLVSTPAQLGPGVRWRQNALCWIPCASTARNRNQALLQAFLSSKLEKGWDGVGCRTTRAPPRIHGRSSSLERSSFRCFRCFARPWPHGHYPLTRPTSRSFGSRLGQSGEGSSLRF